jgi:hypothetical protein
LLANSMVPLAVGLGAASEGGNLVLLVGEDRIKAVGERAHLYAMLHSHSWLKRQKRKCVRCVQFSHVLCGLSGPIALVSPLVRAGYCPIVPA